VHSHVAQVLLDALEPSSDLDEVLVLHVGLFVDFEARSLAVEQLLLVELGCAFVVVDELGRADELDVVVLLLVELVFEIHPLLGFADEVISVFIWYPVAQS